MHEEVPLRNGMNSNLLSAALWAHFSIPLHPALQVTLQLLHFLIALFLLSTVTLRGQMFGCIRRRDGWDAKGVMQQIIGLLDQHRTEERRVSGGGVSWYNIEHAREKVGEMRVTTILRLGTEYRARCRVNGPYTSKARGGCC